jgi:hypothetical protein
MEFWDINLTKGSSLLLHAIYSPLFWRILKITILLSGFNNPYKNPQNKKPRFYSRKAFCRTENEGRKPDKNSSLRSSVACVGSGSRSTGSTCFWAPGSGSGSISQRHRLNMELDLQSLFGLHVTWCVRLFSLCNPLVRGMDADPDPSIMKQK